MKKKNVWVVLEKVYYKEEGIEHACSSDTSDIWLFNKKEDAIRYIEKRLENKKYNKSQLPGIETSIWEASYIISSILYRRVYELRNRIVF